MTPSKLLVPSACAVLLAAAARLKLRPLTEPSDARPSESGSGRR